MTKIYPIAFNPCILHCYKDAFDENVCTLFIENTCDTHFISLAFSEKIYEGTLITCDLVEARDSGYPFLILTNVFEMNGIKIEETINYEIRLILLRDILQDLNFFNIHNQNNEFRLKTPTFFQNEMIADVQDNIIPNFYGIVFGVAFTSQVPENPLKAIGFNGLNEFLIRKTKFPDVFEIFYDSGLTPVKPNNILYIPNISTSKKIFNLLQTKNSGKILCSFNSTRQKWQMAGQLD